MPTLYLVRSSVAIQMYPDNHNPPHFHLVGPDFEIMVRLDNLDVLEGSGKIARRIFQDAIAWAEANKEELYREWVRLNER